MPFSVKFRLVKFSKIFVQFNVSGFGLGDLFVSKILTTSLEFFSSSLKKEHFYFFDTEVLLQWNACASF